MGNDWHRSGLHRETLWIRVVLVALAVGISVYLLSLPTLRSKSPCAIHEKKR
jgi:hypothetical protein